MNPLLKKVLGESDEAVIPADAVELDRTVDVVGKPLNPIAKVVQEPSKPSGDKEKYLTPYSALTAPDCTPGAMDPIDPAQVPGSQGAETFKASDLGKESPGMGREDAAVRAMDVLLGKSRMGTPAHNAAEFEQQGRAMTAEEAAAMINRSQLNEEVAGTAKAYAASAVVSAQEGGSMPEPAAQSDGRQIYSAFRKFV